MEIFGLLFIIIGIPICIIGITRTKQKEADYASRVRAMSDASLKSEVLNLAQQSRKLPLVIPRHTDLATHAYRIKRNHDVAMAEFKRRGLRF